MTTIENQQTEVLKRRGRPPAFNHEEALEKGLYQALLLI